DDAEIGRHGRGTWRIDFRDLLAVFLDHELIIGVDRLSLLALERNTELDANVDALLAVLALVRHVHVFLVEVDRVRGFLPLLSVRGDAQQKHTERQSQEWEEQTTHEFSLRE